MGKLFSELQWINIVREQEEKLRFDAFTRNDALSIGLMIVRLAKEKYDGNISVSITEDDNVIFCFKMTGTTLENDSWILRKRNVSKATGVSSLRAYLEIENGQREETWSGRETNFACGGCMPILMREGATFAYITVSGLEHNADHQVIADAIAEHLNVTIGTVA